MGISKPSSCESCPLHTMGTGWVPLEHNASDILIVGEAPGENEANEGKPFVGAAGKHLRWLLSLRGMQREDFSIHNVLSCRPPDNRLRGEWYEGAAIQHCSSNLDATIQKVRPKVIVALGNTPLRRLCGVDGIDRLRGFVLSTYDGIPVVPTYHPSYLLPRKGQPSTSHHIPLVIRDLLLAKRIAKSGFEREVFTVLEDPTPTEFAAYVDAYEKALAKDPDLPLAVDIETPYKLNHKDEEEFDEVDTQIVRISFGYERGRAVSIPWDTPWMPMIKRLLASAGHKWWWNGWTFDVPIIQAQGVEINGVQEDMMWAFHLLHPDLRYGLERATSLYAPDLPPWKHESQARPAYYSGMDSIALLRTGMGIEQELRSCGMWDLFQKHRVKVYPVLREAGQNGINIDKAERRKLYKKLRKEEKQLLAQIQPLVPDVLRPRKRYKKFPVVHAEHRTIEPVSLRGEVKKCSKCGAENVKASEHTARKGGKKGIPLNECYKAKIEKVTGDVTHYDVVMDFNPLSVKQLMSYVEHFGHPAGTNYKTKSDTLNDLQLEKLEAKYGETHPIYGYVRELRTVRKTISTYIIGLKPNKDGVVKTEYTFKPATGRLSSKGIREGEDRGTNLQNCFDGETEILTPQGWVKFSDLRPTDLVAQFEPSSMGISFVAPTAYIQRNYTGDMVQFLGPRIDALVTPEHRVLTKTVKGVWHVDAAETFLGGRNVNARLMPHAGVRKDGRILTPNERKALQIAVVYQAEAEHKRRIIVCRGERKKKQLVEVFGSRVKDRPNGRSWVVVDDVELSQWLNLEDKTFLADKILELCADDLKWFIEEIHKWDGDFTRKAAYYQKGCRKNAVDVVQAAAMLCGYSTSMRATKGGYVVNINNRPLRHYVRMQTTTVPFNGAVYCVTVPSGFIVVRRNGKAVISGNCPHRGDHPYADDIRRMIVPPPGYVFVEADSSSIEAVMTGHFMNDPEYIALAQQGIHAYVTCKELGLEFTPENVKKVKAEHQVVYERNKRTNHGVNYGMGAWLMAQNYPAIYKTQAEAKAAIDNLYRLLPKLRDYHHSIRVRAAKDTYLVSPWKYRRYFYDVFQYVKDREGNVIIDPLTGKPKIKLGEDSKAVIAQNSQNGAAAFMLDNTPLIAEEIKAIGGILPGNFLVHDSTCVCVPVEKVEQAADILVKYLTRPIPELNGLRIGCEVKMGTNWGPGMQTIRVVKV